MIFDTSALSAYADGDAVVIERAQRAAVIAIPVIVLGEYLFGIAQSRQSVGYKRWIDGFLTASRTLAVDTETAGIYAQVRLELKSGGRPIPSNDLWIAALCRQYNLPLLSRNRHFDIVKGLCRISW